MISTVKTEIGRHIVQKSVCLLSFLYTAVTATRKCGDEECYGVSMVLAVSVIKQLGSRLNNPECRHRVSSDLSSDRREHPAADVLCS